MPTCEWRECAAEAVILQRHAIDRPVGPWGTDKWPTMFEPDISRLCREHAKLGLIAMADEYRDWTLVQLSLINEELQRIFDIALTVGWMPASTAARVRELVARHSDLIAEARQFLQHLHQGASS